MQPPNENKTEMIAPTADAKVVATETLASKIESGKTQTHKVISTPNKREKKSTMAEKMVRIKLLHPCTVGGEIYEPGTVLEVPESEANQLCKHREGHFKFSGERPDSEVERHNMTRAEKVN